MTNDEARNNGEIRMTKSAARDLRHSTPVRLGPFELRHFGASAPFTSRFNGHYCHVEHSRDLSDLFLGIARDSSTSLRMTGRLCDAKFRRSFVIQRQSGLDHSGFVISAPQLRFTSQSSSRSFCHVERSRDISKNLRLKIARDSSTAPGITE
jgi:hypothetical protein